jgi:hypothetical protein
MNYLFPIALLSAVFPLIVSLVAFLAAILIPLAVAVEISRRFSGLKKILVFVLLIPVVVMVILASLW